MERSRQRRSSASVGSIEVKTRDEEIIHVNIEWNHDTPHHTIPSPNPCEETRITKKNDTHFYTETAMAIADATSAATIVNVGLTVDAPFTPAIMVVPSVV